MLGRHRKVVANARAKPSRNILQGDYLESMSAARELVFFDTNILLYIDDAGAAEKQRQAAELFDEYQRAEKAVLSLQVLQEYFSAATRKLGVPANIAQRKVEILARGKIARIGSSDVIAAIEMHRLTQISFWDALIVQAARIAGTPVLYSEDFQHGSVLGGVRIVNPFLKRPHRS